MRIDIQHINFHGDFHFHIHIHPSAPQKAQSEWVTPDDWKISVATDRTDQSTQQFETSQNICR